MSCNVKSKGFVAMAAAVAKGVAKNVAKDVGTATKYIIQIMEFLIYLRTTVTSIR